MAAAYIKSPTELSFNMLLRTILNLILELLLGIIIGVITVRVYRRIIIATQQNDVKGRSLYIGYISITKLIIAYVSVCNILDIDILYPTISATVMKSREDRVMIFSTFERVMQQFIHLLIYTTGIKIGQALQPVGLTGGIATGKSTVSRLLSKQQRTSDTDDEKKDTDEVEFVIIDVDGIAHDILLPTYNDTVYDRLVNEFGTDILMRGDDATSTSTGRGKDNTTLRPLIDRRKLGDVVFKDRNKRRKLNSITHPKIIKIMIKSILYEGLNLGMFMIPSSSNNKRKKAGRHHSSIM